jgi:hypothetical protein
VLCIVLHIYSWLKICLYGLGEIIKGVQRLYLEFKVMNHVIVEVMFDNMLYYEEGCLGEMKFLCISLC